jgi:hypothetical protein
MEETWKRGRPGKRYEVKVKKDLNIKGIKTGRHLSEIVGRRRRRRRRRRRKRRRRGEEEGEGEKVR